MPHKKPLLVECNAPKFHIARTSRCSPSRSRGLTRPTCAPPTPSWRGARPRRARRRPRRAPIEAPTAIDRADPPTRTTQTTRTARASRADEESARTTRTTRDDARRRRRATTTTRAGARAQRLKWTSPTVETLPSRHFPTVSSRRVLALSIPVEWTTRDGGTLHVAHAAAFRGRRSRGARRGIGAGCGANLPAAWRRWSRCRRSNCQ